MKIKEVSGEHQKKLIIKIFGRNEKVKIVLGLLF